MQRSYSAKDRTPKGMLTREKILERAMSTLIEEWYDGVTLRSVAKRCDIQLGNLQYYFPTRDSLLLALIEREAAKDVQAIEAQFVEHGSPEKAFRIIIEEIMHRWRRKEGVVYVVLRLLRKPKREFADLYRKIYQRHYDTLATLIQRINPKLSDKEIAQKSRLITALLDGAVLQVVSTKDRKKYIETTIEHALNIASN